MKLVTALILTACVCWPQTIAANDTEKMAKSHAAQRDGRSLQNVRQVTGTVYCGGEPSSEAAFAELVSLGIKVVVSVDGKRPDVATARDCGLTYVHIPIGYDGVDKAAGLSLARLVREHKVPIYIHCHHGRHRGPAAAAIACIAMGSMVHQEALEFLHRAGTSKNYAGLWRSVEQYHAPAADVELPQLVEVSKLDSFVLAMAQVDRGFANLQRCSDARWRSPPNHPDLVALQQALIVKEGLRESRRSRSHSDDPSFSRELAEAELFAQEIEGALRANDHQIASARFLALGRSCNACHQRFRN